MSTAAYRRKLYRQAKAWIQKKGWSHGAWGIKGGEMCIIGTLNHLNGLKLREKSEIDELEREYPEVVRATCGLNPIQYNDAPGRTKEDILRVLDCAIENTRETA